MEGVHMVVAPSDRAAKAIGAGCSDAQDGAKGVMQKSGQG